MGKYFNQTGVIQTLPLLIIIAAVGIISFLLVSSTAPLNGLFGTTNPKPPSRAATSSPCQFQKADQPLNIAFCDTFDQPMPTGDRAGDLNGSAWGVSRTTSDDNPSQGHLY